MNLPAIILLLFAWPSLMVAHAPADSIVSMLRDKDARSILVYANKFSGTDPVSAKLAFALALEKAKSEGSSELQFDVLRDNGLFFEDHNSLEDAELCYVAAFNLAETADNKPEKLIVLNDLAILSRKKGKYENSKNYHLSALELASALGDAETEEYSLHGLGFLYETVGDHQEALEFYRKSFLAAEQRNSTNGMIVTLRNISAAYRSLGNLNEAKITLQKALVMAKQQKDTSEIGNCYFDLGLLLIDDFEEAGVGKLDSALFWLQVKGDINAKAETENFLATYYAKKGDHRMSSRFFNRCLNHHEFVSATLLAKAHIGLGQLLDAQKEYDKSLLHFQKAYAISKEQQLSKYQMEAAKELHNWYTRKDSSKQALSYLLEANTLSDSLNEVHRHKGTADLQFRFGLEHNERAIQELQIRQNKLMFSVLLLVGILFICSLGIVIYLRKRNIRLLRAKNKDIKLKNQRLEDWNAFLSQFTYAVAHDLKEPLRTIGAFIFLLERSYKSHFDEDGASYMKFVQDGVKRMNSLIKDLLEYSMISVQRASGDLTNVPEVFKKVEQKLQEEIELKNAHLEIAEPLGDIMMNPVHLSIILQHLIQNGLKFNNSEAPEVRVKVVNKDHYSLIEVADNGIGIDMEYSKKIFELFHQLNKNKPYGGTGIGLTIVKNIVEKYEGEIWFESKEGQGATFFVKIPQKSHQNEAAVPMFRQAG